MSGLPPTNPTLDSIDQVQPSIPSAPPHVDTAPQAPRINNALTNWVRDNEILSDTALYLLSVLTRVKVVMLVDDSGSMGSKIVEPGAQMNLFSSQNQKTRWMEAQQAAFTLVNMLTAIPNEYGFDVWFLNRGKVLNVSKPSDLEAMFMNPPSGGTPLNSTLNNIFSTYSNLTSNSVHVLLLVLSDGEPSDVNGNINVLINSLNNKPSLFHVSLIECNDNEEEMAFMDSLDGKIFNFHNSDDYRLELSRVKSQQGNNFKYTYTDYIIGAVLSTFIPSYFLLDQNKTSRVTISPLPDLPRNYLQPYLEGVVFANSRTGNTQIQPSINYQNQQPTQNSKYPQQPQQGQPMYVPPNAYSNSTCQCLIL